MSGFRDLENFAEDLRLLRGRHRFVPAPVIGAQVLNGGPEVLGADAFRVGQEAVKALQAGGKPEFAQTKPYGCGVKYWRAAFSSCWRRLPFFDQRPHVLYRHRCQFPHVIYRGQDESA